MSRLGLRILVVVSCVSLVFGWAGYALASAPIITPAGQESAVAPDPARPDIRPAPLPPDAEAEFTDPTDEQCPPGADCGPGAIIGRVRSGFDPHNAEPLPGATIWLFRKLPHRVQFVAGTHTGPEGGYAFRPVRPGRYLLVASAPDHFPDVAGVRVSPGQEKVRRFLLHPVGSPDFGVIVGHVFDVGSAGHGEPLPGAVVRLFREDGVVREVVTNQYGFYLMEEILPGEYGICGQRRGPSTGRLADTGRA